MPLARAALLAIFLAALASSVFLVFTSSDELDHLGQTITEIDREVEHARHFRDVMDKMSQSILSFTAVALDVSVDDRIVVLAETNIHFVEFQSAVIELQKIAAKSLTSSQQAELTDSLEAVAHSWVEIRDQFDTGIEDAAKAFHFLQITDEVRTARKILVALEEAAAQTARRRTRQAFDRLENSAALLTRTGIVVGVSSLLALLGMGGFMIAMRRANNRLQDTLCALRHRDQALMIQNQRFDAALGNMSQGLCMFDADERLIVANQRFGEIFRLPESLLKSGTTIRDLEDWEAGRNHVPPKSQAESFVCALRSLLPTNEPGTITQELSDGRAVEIWYRPMQDGGWVTTFEDVTERRQAEAQIAHMARHDALTGLGNRALFRDEMNRVLVRTGRGETIGVLCLDLDRFKIINDTLGHPTGDALLQAVADRLRSCIREVDTAFRLGGDEFAVIAIDSSIPDGTVGLAERIIAAISLPYDIGDQQLNVGASIGVAFAPGDGKDPDRLLKAADLALYRAKEDGKGRVRVFEPEMDQRLQSRRMLELELRRALDAGEFVLHYQPLLDVNTNEVSAFEALLRWENRDRGTVSPADFIPLAEEVGLIIPLSEWVLHEACCEAAAWPQPVKVAVNLSPIHFYHGDLVKTVSEALQASSLEPGRLELEITEGVLLQDTQSTIVTLTALKRLGVRIAMDDFGTGYCSLSYLQRFPFDKIKIDQTFVKDLGCKAEALAIIRAVSGLATSLGMATTAEGVETTDQLRKIKTEGCTEAQGYLFSKPVPADAVPELLFAQAHRKQSAA